MKNLRQLYQQGLIEKHDYINRMHNFHSLLFDYRDFLKNNIVKEIQITDKGIIMWFRNYDLQMVVDEYDERTAPIEALNFYGYENDETVFILNLLGNISKQNFTILDIGANVGWYSLNISKRFPLANIHAFEPIPKTYDYLNENIEINQIKNITTNNFGLSNEEKEVIFYYYKEGSGNSSLKNLSIDKDIEKIHSRVCKLDNYVCKNNLKVDFIKCDVEGAELFVFEGGVNTLQEQKPIIFTEMLRKWAAKFDYHPNDIIFLIKQIGYSCYILQNGVLSEIEEVNDKTIETNYFFLHNIAHKEQIRLFCK